MAKGGDLIGKSGGAGFGPVQKPKPTIPIVDEDSKTKDPKHPDFKPPKDQKPTKGGGGPTGGAPSSVRPKV